MIHFTSAKSIWVIRIVWTIIALGLVIALGRALPLSAAGLTPVFINEIHYDNTGTDTGEAIEIAGPAGTDLAGWKIVLYNGSGGASYNTRELSGVLADQQNGYGTQAFQIPGIQNGSPDGVALVDPTGTVIQFLSYEGEFTAVGGPADGMTSTDIGKIEGGGDPVGHSLQLAGIGTSYEDFSWQSPAASTFGSPNTGQILGDVLVVRSIYPADNASDADSQPNISIQFSKAVSFGADWYTFTCQTSGAPELQETLGSDTASLLPATQLAPLEVCTLTLDASRITAQEGGQTLVGETVFEFTVTSLVCGEAATAIHEIQGSGDASQSAGATGIVIEGVVVGDHQDPFGGFFVQEEDTETDNDAATSEGIFVYDSTYSWKRDVKVGDVVRVEGKVTEYQGMTELTDLTRLNATCGTGSVTPTPITLPQTTPNEFERYEGMLVKFEQPLVVSEHYDLGRYGELVLSAGSRLYQPTHLAAPGPEAQAVAEANALNRIYLDDANNSQNPDPVPYLPKLSSGYGTLRAGTTVNGVSGVMDYRFGVYRIQPPQAGNLTLNLSDTNPRPQTAPAVGGSVKVAAANVLNYFSTLDGSGNICGPQGGQECRGADSAQELERQRTKILEMLEGLNADVVGLIEIENHPADAALVELTNSLNGILGGGVYAPILTNAIGTDAIRVALIYKPGVVTPVGGYQVLDSSDDPRFIDALNRPVLAQTFVENATGERFTVAVTHLKSKGSECEGDPDTGQGNCNLVRTQAAAALADWLKTDPTGSGDPDYLIVGDLNAYAKEDPITTLLAANYTDLLNRFNGPGVYSYIFDDQSGYLDHALSNASLTGQVSGAAPWHINADEPRILDYNVEFKYGDQVTTLYSPDAYRSSDHDPLLVGLCLVSVSVTPSTLWPANHQMVEVVPAFNGAMGQVTGVTVTSSEPDNGLGDGDTAGDYQIGEGGRVYLRAERAGGGPGRVYTVTYQITNRCGDSLELTATVTVPANQGSGKPDKGGQPDGSATTGKDAAGVRAAEGQLEYRIFLPGIIR